MHKFRGTLWMVLAIGLLGVSSAAVGKQVCTTDKDGKKHCFEYRCLPSEKHKLPTHVVADPVLKICKIKHKFPSPPRDREHAVKMLAEECASGGGVLRDGGDIVTCSPAPATDAKAGPSAAIAGGVQPVTVHVTPAVATEIDRLLDGHNFSKETSALLVQLVHQASGPFHGFKQSGGWCWNDDGTFYGSVPCPKAVNRSDVGREKR